MAFVRTKSVNGHEYRYLVRSVREGDKVRQETVAYLGKYRTLLEAIDALRAQRVFACGRLERCNELLAGASGRRRDHYAWKAGYWQDLVQRCARRLAALEAVHCSA